MNMKSLINELNYLTELYDKGIPKVSDADWDEMYFALKKEEEETGIIYPNSPTQKIHYKIVSQLNKVKHNHSMLSLDKTKDINDIIKFFHGQEFICMFKMDGLTVSLTYEDGKLIRAETRGDGYIGEDVTHNAKVVENIPQIIPNKNKITIDGEIICRKDNFEEFKEEYKNPRNFAAGSIRLLSAEECAKRKLSFIAWDLIDNPLNMVERIETLTNLGFTTVPYLCGFDVKWAFNYMENIDPDDLDNFVYDHDVYPTDGYVFKFNDTVYGNKQGQTDHHFKNAIALKLYDETYSTRLRHIQWTMGRTGVLTPVAVFDPINIDGSTIEKASLHNVSMMKEILGDCAYLGEPLKIFKANQIIPQIAEAGPKYSYGEVIAAGGVSANDSIEKCPICHKDVIYKKSADGTISVYCENPNCEGKLINILNHFFGKKGLDIKGLSKATFEKLIDWGWVNSIIDVFYLSNYDKKWIKKPGFGEKSVFKILNAIEEGKHTTLDAFISAIGIPLIGKTVAKDLSNYFNTYLDFRNAVKDNNYNFAILDNFGEEMNNSIKHFNYTEADKIYELLSIENLKNEKNDKLKGKNIVITGKLKEFKNRDELKNIIEQYGGKVVNSISNKTNILINNDINSNSSKNKMAKSKNIPIISEKDFIEKYFEN